MESIENFLRSGRGVIYGEGRPRTTVTVSQSRDFNHRLVDKIVRAALQHQPTIKLLGSAELLSAAVLGEKAVGIEEAVKSWDLVPGSKISLASSLDLVVAAWGDIPPPILWDLSEDAQWALMEGDVSVVHVVRVDSFVGMRRENASILSVIDTPHPGSQLPWTFELLLGEEVMTMSGNAVRDVVCWHETIESAGARMLEGCLNFLDERLGTSSPS